MRVQSAAVSSALLWACATGTAPPAVPASAQTQAASSEPECADQSPGKPPPDDDEKLRAVDATASLALFEQLVVQDPTDPALLWQLALAYESQQRWDAAATTFARAAVLAPTETRYWYRSGRAWLSQGAAGDLEAYDAAHEPLEKCIELRPSFAQCYFLLGEAEEWTDNEQGAAERYEQAVLHDPVRPRYYLRLSELYASFRRYPEAEKVLTEGIRLVPATSETDGERCLLHLELARLARLRHDPAAELAALAGAELLADAARPEVLFELGISYATLEAPSELDEQRRQKAVTLLVRFFKRVCRGSSALDFRDSCDRATIMLQRLGQ